MCVVVVVTSQTLVCNAPCFALRLLLEIIYSVVNKFVKMNAKISVILNIICFSTKILASKKSAYFVKELVDDQPAGLVYKRIGASTHFGLFGQNSQAQCAVICLHEDSCRSFYMDSGACVFCVNEDDDVTVFTEGQNVNPEPEQEIKRKG